MQSRLAGSEPKNVMAYALVAHAVILSGAMLFLGYQIEQLVKSQHQGIAMPAMRAEPARVANSPAAAPAAPQFDQSKLRVVSDSDYVYGDKNAKLSLIAYMDYECPFCSTFYPTAKQFVDQSEGKVNFVVRLFPLAFHSHANTLATAALCVGEQKGSKGFYDYTDKMYAHGASFSGDVDGLIAETLKLQHLDGAKFTQCEQNSKSQDTLQRSAAEGKEIGVKGTPSMVLVDAGTKKAKFMFGTKTVAQLQEMVGAMN